MTVRVPARRISFLVGLAMAGLLTLGGCGGKPPGATASSPTADSRLASLVPAPIRSKGSIVAAMSVNAPYVNIESSKITGVMPDLYRAIGDKLGLKVEFVETRFDAVIPGVQSGRFDMSAPLGDFVERQQQVDFADFAQSQVSALVKASGQFRPTEAGDLCGHVAGVENGANTQLVIQDINKSCATPITMKTFPDLNAANLALDSGRIDVVIAPTAPNGYAAKQSNGRFVAQKINGTEKIASGTATYGIVCKKDSGLAQALNAVLIELQKSGEYDKIFKRWGLEQSEIAADKFKVNGSTQSQKK
jgi:polar amino acid transport system substrate-binding protein